jgi:hypothetical protein
MLIQKEILQLDDSLHQLGDEVMSKVTRGTPIMSVAFYLCSSCTIT